MPDRRRLLILGAGLGIAAFVPATSYAGTPPDAAVLARRVAAARGAFQQARYAQLDAGLPALLDAARGARAAAAAGSRRQAACAALARVHVVAGELRVKQAQIGQAREHAEAAAAAAEESGCPYALAEALRSRATPLRREGRAREAVVLLQGAVDRLEPGPSEPGELDAARGTLALTAAYSAAVGHQPHEARLLMETAYDALGRLNSTAVPRFPEFGLAQVQLYAIGVDIQLGDPATAAHTARRFHPGALPTCERRARRSTDYARALLALGRYGEVLEELLAIEEAAPQEARRPSVRMLTAELLRHCPLLPGLAPYAARTGAALH